MNSIINKQIKPSYPLHPQKPIIQSMSNLNSPFIYNSIQYNHKRGKSSDPLFKSQNILNSNTKNEIELNSLITQSQNNINLINYNIESSQSRDAFSLSPSKTSNIKPLLPPKEKKFKDKKTLLLDLDETLVHSGFKQFNPNIPSDLIMNIELENQKREIHVLIRPGVKEFLDRISKRFEIIIFTASLSKYASPLIDILDNNNLCSYRLFREHCTFINGAFIKDLKRLDRNLKDVILLDNSPIAYMLHPENGFPIKTWYDDKSDRELYNLAPIIEFLSYVDDVRKYIPKLVENNQISLGKAMNIISEYNQKLKLEKENADNELSKRGINIKIVNNNYNNFVYNNNSINNNKRIDVGKLKKRNIYQDNESGSTNTNNSNITNSSSSRYNLKKNNSFKFGYREIKSAKVSNHSTITKNTNDNSRNNSNNNSGRISINNIKNIKVQKVPKVNNSNSRKKNLSNSNNNSKKKNNSNKKENNRVINSHYPNYIDSYNTNPETKRKKIPLPKKNYNTSKKSPSKSKIDQLKIKKTKPFQSNSYSKCQSSYKRPSTSITNSSSRIYQYYTNKVYNYNSVTNSKRNINLKLKNICSINKSSHQRNKSYETDFKNNKMKNISHSRSKSSDKVTFYTNSSNKKKNNHKKNKSFNINQIRKFEEINHYLQQPHSSRYYYIPNNNYNNNPYL
jgi:Dullard-like phosphatase family protein